MERPGGGSLGEKGLETRVSRISPQDMCFWNSTILSDNSFVITNSLRHGTMTAWTAPDSCCSNVRIWNFFLILMDADVLG